MCFVGDVGVELLPSRRRFPTNSAEIRKEPTGSTLLTGLMVSTPVPRSASFKTVPAPRTDVRSAYDARRLLRIDPVYAGGAPSGGAAGLPDGVWSGELLSEANRGVSVSGAGRGGLMTTVE